MSEDYDLVRSCISKGARLNEWVHGSIWRTNKALELFQILVPAGLDVNYNFDTIGGYVAATACHNQMELTRYLLEHGADPNRNPVIGLYPALDMAVKESHADMAEMLIKYGAKVDGLGASAMAAQYRRFEMMELLFRHGADVNDDARDRVEVCIDFVERTTALHRAAEAGHVDVVVYLIERGANPDLNDEDGRTPSGAAVENGRPEVAEVLNNLQRG